MESSNGDRLERLFQAWQKKKEAAYGTPPPSPGGHSRASISRSFDKMVQRHYSVHFNSLLSPILFRCYSVTWTRSSVARFLMRCSQLLLDPGTRSSSRATKETTSTSSTRARSTSSLMRRKWSPLERVALLESWL